jgi:hypothetical protein
MKRDYDTGIQENVTFFVGVEVEKTPAFGKLTLFVTGLQKIEDINHCITSNPEKIEHIFFGANHSYKPRETSSWKAWEDMIMHFLDKGYLCSLDIPMEEVEEFNEGGLNEYNNFIPQIRVPIPYIRLWNYNTMLKIDDNTYNGTNPGVWCHRLDNLMDYEKFTPWSNYTNDKVIK